MTESIRIQSLMAQSGVGSRRACDRLVTEGRVTINGKVAQIGQTASWHDDVRVDGKSIGRGATETRLLLLNKPSGYVCSTVGEDGLKSVYQLLPKLKSGRWCLVGRLDATTTGLLLVTNSGSLAQTLTHPKHKLLRTYRVRVFGVPPRDLIKQLKDGVMVDGERVRCYDARWLEKRSSGHNQWLLIQLWVGKQHIVKKLCESFDLTVTRLIRTGFGRLQMPKALHVGSWVELDVPNFMQANKL